MVTGRGLLSFTGVIALTFLTVSATPPSVAPIVFEGTLAHEVRGSINRSVQYIFVYRFMELVNRTQAFRIHVGSNNASDNFPLLIVVRQQRSILSWQVPLSLDYQRKYNEVSRTLCPVESQQKGQMDVNQTIFVELSSDSVENIDFRLNVSEQKQFELKLRGGVNFTLTPSEPIYYKVDFPDDGSDYVRVVAESPHNSCMIMSVQDTHCPVFDLVRNVEFKGTHMTVTTKGAITVQKRQLDTPKEFYVVFVLLPTDYPCNSHPMSIKPSRGRNHIWKHERLKTISLTIEATLDYSDYYIPVFGAVAFFLSFYVAAGLIAIGYHVCDRRRALQNMDESSHEYEPLMAEVPITHPNDQEARGNYGTTDPNRSITRELSPVDELPQPVHRRQLSADSDDFDKLEDTSYDKDILRTKKDLFVADLSRKTPKHLTKKYRLYHWYLIIIAIFYGLPVIQLVITYQKVFRVTGNEDICFYNFYCANPFGLLAAFNNIISNIGYIMLGLLFLGLTARRDYMYRKAVEFSETFQTNHGIPQYFGLFYAVGIALIMEGVLSACYHVCPSSSNFQFDTAFMYVLACLLMLKIYQTRHPDVNASAHAAYMLIALIILISVLGVFYGTLTFWVIFSIALIAVSLFLTVEVYYMGRWAMNLGLPRRLINLVRNDGFKSVQPNYRDRMILLLIINCVNFGLAIYGVCSRPLDFSSFLLSILMANLIMYFAFYIIMKLRSKERFKLMPLFYILVACITWAFSIFFFVQHSNSWERTAAASRELNSRCILLNFYDVHDVWHFLSSMSLFFSFMVLLTLDDDLVYVPRNQIPVF